MLNNITSDVLIRYFILSLIFSVCSFQGTHFDFFKKSSGEYESRTRDLLLARQVLSQLSYTPIGCGPPRLYGLSLLFDSVLSNQSAKPFLLSDLLGLSGLEPPTSRLSGVRSNQLSYKPILIWRPPTLPHRLQCSTIGRSGLNHRVRDGNGCYP